MRGFSEILQYKHPNINIAESFLTERTTLLISLQFVSLEASLYNRLVDFQKSCNVHIQQSNNPHIQTLGLLNV